MSRTIHEITKDVTKLMDELNNRPGYRHHMHPITYAIRDLGWAKESLDLHVRTGGE